MLKAEVLSQSLADYAFTLTPHFIYNAATGSNELSYLDITTPTWEYEGDPVTVYEGTVAFVMP